MSTIGNSMSEATEAMKRAVVEIERLRRVNDALVAALKGMMKRLEECAEDYDQVWHGKMLN